MSFRGWVWVSAAVILIAGYYQLFGWLFPGVAQ